MLKTPFSPLIAQLTDRAGMMVSPKAAKEAGDKFGLHPVCAGPYKFVERVQQDRIVFEKFADYWNKDNVHIDRVVFLPIVDATVRLANLKSGGLDLIERLLATDIKDVRADPKLKLATAIELGYQGIDINVANGNAAKGPLGQSAKVRQALDLSIDREAINQVVFNGEFKPGNQWVSPEHPYYQKAFPVPKRDVAKAKALLKEAGVTAPFEVDFMVPKGAETQAVAEVIQAMAAEVGIDMKIRVTEFATSLKQAEAGEYQAYLLAWSGRTDPDGNSYIFHKMQGAAELQRPIATRRSTSCSTSRACLRSGAAQGDLREAHQDHPRRRADPLPLSPPDPDRAHHQARRLQADAGRTGARARAEAEVSVSPRRVYIRTLVQSRRSDSARPDWGRARRLLPCRSAGENDDGGCPPPRGGAPC